MGTIPRPKGSLKPSRGKGTGRTQVIISSLLQSMLGFRQPIFPAEEYVSDWVADVRKGLNYLYVYCPLVEPRMVGDAQVPLLRIVPV